MKSKNAIIWIYLGLILLFTLFVIPVNKETGYIHKGTYTPYEKEIGIAPIWSVDYSVEVREGNYNSEVYSATSINYYLHALSLIVITLCCGFYYFMTKSKPRE